MNANSKTVLHPAPQNFNTFNTFNTFDPMASCNPAEEFAEGETQDGETARSIASCG